MNNEITTLNQLNSNPVVVVDRFEVWSEQSPVFKQLTMLADKFAKSELVPAVFQNKPTNCFIALQIAHRAAEDPFEVLQNLNVLHGKPTFSSQYLIARANRSPVFASRLMFEEYQDAKRGLVVKCSATLSATGEIVSMEADMKMAIDEGWAAKNKKYQTMPAVMLGYRAATFLVRRHAPEISLGLQTSDEAEDLRQTGTGFASGKSAVESASAAHSLNAAVSKRSAKSKSRDAPPAQEPEEGAVGQEEVAL